MWILLFVIIALAIAAVIAYRRHRAAARRWKDNLAASDRPPIITQPTEPIFSKATPRYTPRPAAATLTGQRPSPPARRPTRPVTPSRETRPSQGSSSSPFDYGLFTPITDSSPSVASTPDEPFKGHGGGFGGAGASGGWSSEPVVHSHDPSPSYSADPSPDPSPSPDISFNND